MARDQLKIDVDFTIFQKLVDKLEKGLNPKGASALYILMETEGKKMENFARNRSIWSWNRTGDARRRLIGGAMPGKDEVSAFVGHGVFYGKFLELAHQRKYAILQKAVEEYRTETAKEIIDLINRLK